ncbi:MAG: lasso peptide biosynthesis PqqD family chaperone [Bacillota bacterium]|jgi:hypothetical protein
MKGAKISRETIISRQDGIISSDLEGEKAMMSIKRGKYYCLNGVGSSIWELLARPITIQELMDELMKEYQVEEETCLRDVSLFLNKMHREGIICLDEQD